MSEPATSPVKRCHPGAPPEEKSNLVFINVYDLGGVDFLQKVNKFSTLNNKLFIGGIFHVGVQVYGEEWGFGATDEDESGVYPCAPRGHPDHAFRACVWMGPTPFSQSEVRELLADMMQSWRGHEYDFIHHNCLDFADVCCSRLGVGRIPGWIDRFRRLASSVGWATAQLNNVWRSLGVALPFLPWDQSSGQAAITFSATREPPLKRRRPSVASATISALRGVTLFRPRISRAADVDNLVSMLPAEACGSG